MTIRDKRQRHDPPKPPTSPIRGAPYKATTRRGGLRQFERNPIPPPSNLPPLQARTPNASADQGLGEAVPSRGGQNPPPMVPLPPKVSFGGRPTRSGKPAIVAAVAIGAILLLGAAVIALGSRLSSSQRGTEEGSPAVEAPSGGSPQPGTGGSAPSQQRIRFGSYEVVIPEGWQVVAQGATSLQLRNPSTGATMEIRFFYRGSHEGLRPQCPGSPSPSPTPTRSPTPSPFATSGQPSYKIRNTGTTSVAGTSGEIQEGDLICPGSELRSFATVTAPSAAIGISYEGDPADLRFLLSDLIEPV